MEYPPLSLITFYILKSNLSAINLVSAAFICSLEKKELSIFFPFLFLSVNLALTYKIYDFAGDVAQS